jgi:hypothetical protein
MTGNEQRKCTPCRLITGALALGALAFGLAVLTGYLEVRRPSRSAPQTPDEPKSTPGSECSTQRLKAAESLTGVLLDGPKVRWVYKFKGGLPRCWVEVESDGKKQTLAQWNALQGPVFLGPDPTDRPLLESVEGYVALIGPYPKEKEQTYRLVCGVTRIKYPENPNRQTQITGFREGIPFALPEVPPDPGAGGRFPPDQIGSFESGDEPIASSPGTDRTLAEVEEKVTAGGQRRKLRLWLRFFTPEEVAATK